MAIKICPIPGHEGDKIVIATRRHLASTFAIMFIVFLMLILPMALLIALKITNPGVISGFFINFLVVFGSIYYLVIVTFAFVSWINYYYDIFVVTQNEIIDIDQNGLFDRHITEISLLRVQDVAAQIKGFFPTIFNYGNVIAESAGENTKTYIIDNIPNPLDIANKIMELHNEHIAQGDRAGQVVTAEGDLRGGVAPVPVAANTTTEQSCPPCPACEENKIADNVVTQNKNQKQNSEGNVSNDDLNKGGEVKF